MKYIIMFGIVCMLSACGTGDRIEATLTGYSDNCIDNVMYYQFRNGASVAYNTDGSIKTCGK